MVLERVKDRVFFLWGSDTGWVRARGERRGCSGAGRVGWDMYYLYECVLICMCMCVYDNDDDHHRYVQLLLQCARAMASFLLPNLLFVVVCYVIVVVIA